MLIDKFDDRIFEFIEEKTKFPLFPLPLTVKRAEGTCVYDLSEKKYIDLTSNKENNPFGYSNININSENRFIDSELFSFDDSKKLEQAITSATNLNKAYFSSSSAEIFKFSSKLINNYLKKTGKEKIILSADSARKGLYEFNGITTEFLPLNKLSLIKTIFSRAIGAVIIQLVQINDDVIIADDEYLREIKNLCDKNSALLVFDASLLAPLRINKGLFNYNSEIKPDILIVSKGLSQGFPLCSAVISEKVAEESFSESKAGIYSSAYTAAYDLIKDFQSNKTTDLINLNANYINNKLKELSETHISLVDYYNSGMCFTLLVDISAYDFAKEAFKLGVLIDTLSDCKIILSPPYNIKNEEVDSFISIFDDIFSNLSEFGRLK